MSAAAWLCAAELGLGIGVGTPGEISGIPVGQTHLGMELTGRYVLNPSFAVSGGLGTPLAGEGLTLYAGAEGSVTLLRSSTGFAAWSLYAAPGAQLGFTGPGYDARHSGVFVGWEYIYSGPVTPALRLPVGTALRLGRVELFAEAVPVLGFAPSVELTFGGLAGARFYFGGTP